MVRLFISILFFLIATNTFAQCEDLSLEQEVSMTENVAIVQGLEVIGDSIQIEVIKKWKGDSISQFEMLKYQSGLEQEFRVDSGKVYMLFWYNGLDIDRCSRSSEFKMAHFEYLLDEQLKAYKVLNVPLYDSIQYEKRNVFFCEGRRFDNKKGKFAFYDIDAGELKLFEKLPVETSSYYPKRFYVIDKNVQTAKKKYDIVFGVSKSHLPLKISNGQRKKILQSLYK